MENIFEKSVFGLLKGHFEENDIACLQKKSFDFFLSHRIHKIIEEEPRIEVVLKKNEFFCVEFGQVFVDRPYIVDEKRTIQYITPAEALLRDLTYSSVMSFNIHTIHYKLDEDGQKQMIEEKHHFKIPFARIPMMVGCSKCNMARLPQTEKIKKGMCANDHGGYFIIKGKERVLVAQERSNYNTVNVYETKNTDQKHLLMSEIRSMSDETGHSILIQMKILSSNLRVTVQLPFITQELPIGYVFMAYGCDVNSIESILRRNLGGIDHPKITLMIQGILKDAMIIKDEETAIQYISQFATHVVVRDRRIAYVKQILMNEVFPHLGISSDEKSKLLFLGHMCGRLMKTLVGNRPLDDRDHLAQKRVEVSGVLVGDLFRTLWKRFIRTIIPQLMKRLDILSIISKMNVITMGLRHCFSTGNWGIPKSNYIRTGVSQVLSRLSFNSTLSHLRRIVIPIGKEGRNTKIRQVHPTQVGFICSSETPEGSSAGIVKNLSLIAEVSPGIDPVFVRIILEDIPGIQTDFSTIFGLSVWVKVFLNGNIVGVVDNMDRALDFLYHTKYVLKRLPFHVSFYGEDNEIQVFCDEGRMIRPFFIASKLPTIDELQKKNWFQLQREGIIVWMDPHELENKVIAMFPNEINTETDLCEIHPCLLLGICASMMPFADHTQSPRICYHASMVKQSIGIYSSTNEIRADTIAHVLSYPEKPIVRSHVEEWFGMDKLPCGNNVIVAIACYGGWNQEDSIILNQSSVDRGLFRSFAFRTLVVEEKKKTSSLLECITLPPPGVRIRSFHYGKLDENGIVKPGVFVGSGDVIVGKTSLRQCKSGREEMVDSSVVIKNGEEGTVDKVFCTTTPEGYKMIKIKIRTLKIPEIGDKLCSNCAQKGTIGMTIKREDMPFTSDGIVPDIIINPLCFPAGVAVGFADGLSRPIEKVLDHQSLVWSFDVRQQIPIYSYSMGGEEKGHSPILRLTRKDKKTIDCTPDHKFLIWENGRKMVWKQAKDIVIKKDKLVCGVDLPLDETCPLEKNWLVRFGDFTFDTKEDSGRSTSLALFRLMGYLFGSVLHPKNPIGEKDLENDLDLIPERLNLEVSHGQCGFELLSRTDIPKSLVREFLASFWCVVAELDENKKCLLWKTTKENTIVVSKIVRILLGVFDIDCSVKETKDTDEIILSINDPSLFISTIGVRYDVDMMFRLTLFKAWILSGDVRSFPDFWKDSVWAITGHMSFWVSEIVEREFLLGSAPVYCIGVFTTHTFLAESMVVQNCIPSRMTINQLMESLGGKSAAMKGKFRYSTTFSSHSTNVVDSMKKELMDMGYEKNGNEWMISGITGKPMDAEIFIGPCYYHRLKHLVGSKIHARNHGKVSQLTQQPLEGRSRDGGLRFGEMERDAMISHGNSRFLLERLFDMSDPFRVPVCRECGAMPPNNTVCSVCDGTDIVLIPLPYACKLLFQELNAMGIRINMFAQKD